MRLLSYLGLLLALHGAKCFTNFFGASPRSRRQSAVYLSSRGANEDLLVGNLYTLVPNISMHAVM